jgi:hypothetical protein
LDLCPHLEELGVLRISFDDSDFIAVPEKLQDYPKLRAFHCGYISLGSQQSRNALVNLLTRNNSLQSLEFHPSTRTFVYTGDYQEAERRAKAQLKSLLTETIPQALRNNQSLKRLILSFWGTSSSVPFYHHGAWLELVRDHNMVLVDLAEKSLFREHQFRDFSDHDMPLPLQHFLRLNKAGRRQLLDGYGESLSREDWLLALERANNDLSCLYDILRMNPSIVVEPQE